MTVNSILTAYLMISILKALVKEIRFVVIMIEFVLSCFKSTPLGASGGVFRNQSKGIQIFVKRVKSLFTLLGLVSYDANVTSSELALDLPA